MNKVFLIFHQLIIFFVRAWQKTSFIRYVLNFPQCRFYPSCSNYFIQAIDQYGLFLGFVIFTKRIIRCHPLCSGGIDEVAP